MSRHVLRTAAGLVAYGVAVVAAPLVLPSFFDGLWRVVVATAAAVAATVPTVIGLLGRPEVVTPTLGTLAFVGWASLMWLVVRPLIHEHAGDDRAPLTGEVVSLDAHRPPAPPTVARRRAA